MTGEIALSLLACAALAGCNRAGSDADRELRSAFQRSTGYIRLPSATVDLHAPLEIARGAHDLEIRGDGSRSILRVAPDFKGDAAILGAEISNLTLAGFRIEGNRTDLISDKYLPASNIPFADYYGNNGVLLRDCRNIAIRDLSFREIRAFPLLVSHCDHVTIQRVGIQDCGTLNIHGHSNTTGGILLEQGTVHFAVQQCRVANICGNGIWTHSNYGSPRNSDGLIDGNDIRRTPRDAIQVGHAQRVRVLHNRGGDIGVPSGQADVPGGGTPVAIDTAGDVADSLYSGNHFEDVNGQCIDLDGFHDGQVADNSCINRKAFAAYPLSHAGIVFGNSNPDMEPRRVVVTGNLIQGFAYGGVYLIGTEQQIVGNRFVGINSAHCTGDMSRPGCNYAPAEPGMLRSGIYVAGHAARPADTRSNTIRNNYVSGFGMDRWCIAAAPGLNIKLNRIEGNTCVPIR